MELVHIQEKISEPIELLVPKQQHEPPVSENNEPLILMKEEHPRIFIKSMYYIQNIPNSLKFIYLRKGVYERIQQALNILPKNLSFILYDGYRPFEVQKHLFNQFLDETKKKHPDYTAEEVLEKTLTFVSYPSTESKYRSPHLTGGAIDLTLGDLEGNELDLGTVFDAMDEKSATRYFELHPKENGEALINRRILYNSMIAVGFTNYSEEWWHYDYGNVTWARRVGAPVGIYGAIEADVQDNIIKGYRYI